MRRVYRAIYNFIFKLKKLWMFIGAESDVRYRSNIFVSIWLLFNGFNTDKSIAYNLNRKNKKLYLSDYRRSKTSLANGKYNIILDNKILFADIFSKVFNVPITYGIISDGCIKKLYSQSPIYDYDSMVTHIFKYGALVIKPIIGGGGKQVYIIKYCDGKLILNNEIIEQDYLELMISKLDDFIISEFIIQSEFSQSLYTHTTNTIRILLYRNLQDDKMHIVAATQRLGTSKTNGMDNVSAGGVSAQIDIESGLIVKSKCIQKDKEIIKYESYHPDTKQNLVGIKIPNWRFITEDICDKLDLFPYIKLVGLDIVLTEKGYQVIEGNSHASPRVNQLNHPLLINDDFKAFLKRYRV